MEFQNLHAYTIFIILASCIQPTLSNHPHNSLTDLNALLSFKSLLTDPNRILKDDWTTNSTFCNWLGVTCGRHKRVTGLNLHDLPLQGMISPHLGNLSFLHELDLANTSLVGQIPESIGKLPRLAILVLHINSLSGHIPSTIFNMSLLTALLLSENNLSGTLPSYSNHTLPPLEYLEISYNQFRGHDVLSNVARCRRLEVLSLSYNYFSGSIPNEIGSLSELTELYLGRNEFSGIIPPSLGNLTKAEKIDLDSCNFTGTIPKELGNLVNLDGLRLENNSLVGFIPITLMNNSQLRFLDISINKLIGHVPIEIGKSLPFLWWFNVAHNQLSGGIKFLSSFSNCKDLIRLQIAVNNLEGDFGISKLMYGESRSIITASMPGTIGYIAPEYSSSGTVSKMSDVYSFGILLLETFTKKKPVDDMFDEELSLRDWVCKTHPHAVLDVVDSRLLENNVGNLQSCLLSVIELGLLCSRNSPKERIPMTDVSKRLQKIKTEYLPVS